MARITVRPALAVAAAVAWLLLPGPAMAQTQILEDRPVTTDTLLDRFQPHDSTDYR